jgi:D-alanyl-D-alanine carboxypeptidase
LVLPHRDFRKHGLRPTAPKKILEGLQRGEIDRSLFTDNANGYFSAQALEDFKDSLGPLGKWESFNQTSQSLRGGMTGRVYLIRFKGKTIRAWTYEMPDGKLEQFQVAVGN